MEDFYDIAIEAAVKAGASILDVYHSKDFEVEKKEDASPLTLADRAANEVIMGYLKDTGIPVLSEEGREIPYEERKKWQRFWLVDPLDGTKEFIKRNDEFTVNIALIEEGKPVFGVVYAPVLKELYVGNTAQGSWLLKGPKQTASLNEIRSNGKNLMSSSTAYRFVHRSFSEGGHTAYRVVASRSHLNDETKKYLEKLKVAKGELEIVSKGSSLKLCMVASGEANEYPRLGPTMEWDVAAAHAVVKGAGRKVFIFGKEEELTYNKEDLLNPWFLVK